MKHITSLCVVTIALLLTGCNTIQGVGQDVQKAGEVLQDAAKKK
jgi:predicted small secreted protein